MDTLNNISDHIHNGNMDDLEYTEFMAEYLPIFIYLLILGVVGTIGNFHVLLVYSLRYKPSNHRIFILCLAVVDFCSCTVSIPFEMYDIRHRYTFTASWACKVFRFLNHTTSVSSGFLLGLIALERFRKACQPTKCQMTVKQAKISCILTVLFSSILAIPAVVIYGANVSDTFWDLTAQVLINTNLSSKYTVGLYCCSQHVFLSYALLFMFSWGKYCIDKCSSVKSYNFVEVNSTLCHLFP